MLTDSVAALRSMVVFDTLRARTRTVLLDQAVAPSSKNQLLVASEACARSPTRASATVTPTFAVVPAAMLGRSHETSAANSHRPEPVQGRRSVGFCVEPTMSGDHAAVPSASLRLIKGLVGSIHEISVIGMAVE